MAGPNRKPISWGQFGTLCGFAVMAIGTGLLVFFQVATGLAFIGVGLLVLVGTLVYAVLSHWETIRARAKRLGTPQIFLLVGIVGTWLFVSVAFGSAAWMIWNQRGFTVGASPIGVGAKEEEGPLVWFSNLTMEGGYGRNVFSLTFHGKNISQREVSLKSADIISAIDGTKLDLEVVAEKEIVPINEIGLVPSGAPLDLVAKFGPPDPDHPGKILGLPSSQFLKTWSKFSLNVQDNEKTYRINFNEGNLAPFFPGMVGPHVAKKVSASE